MALFLGWAYIYGWVGWAGGWMDVVSISLTPTSILACSPWL